VTALPRSLTHARAPLPPLDTHARTRARRHKGEHTGQGRDRDYPRNDIMIRSLSPNAATSKIAPKPKGGATPAANSWNSSTSGGFNNNNNRNNNRNKHRGRRR